MKKWYLSKTVWVNAVALLGAISLEAFGVEIDEKTAAVVLSVLNIVLRSITKDEISW